MGISIDASNQHGIQVINSAQGTIAGNAIYSCSNGAILLQNNGSSQTTGLVSISGDNIMSCVYGIQEVLTTGYLAYNAIGIYNIQGATTAAINLTLNTQYVYVSTRGYISISNALKIPSGIVSSTASADGITPPAQVQGYVTINVGGTDKKSLTTISKGAMRPLYTQA